MTVSASASPVAIDVTPLIGVRTGVGHFVAGLLQGFEALDEPPDLVPYVLSRRARPERDGLPPATRRLRVPAAVALRCWRWPGRPRFDGPLGDARVVHGTKFVAPPSRRRGVVVTVHDCGFALHPDLVAPEARRYPAIVRRLVKGGGWIHTPTERVADEVRELFATDRVRAVPHGVPDVAESDRSLLDGAGIGARTRFLLVLGALDRRKRPDLVVDAFGRLPDDPALADLQLVLAGPPNSASAPVDAAVASLPASVAARVHVLGAVPEPLRATLIREATALVFVPRYEGFGLPLLEAMSVGTPVIASEDAAVVEVGGDCVRYTGDGVDAVAETIADVMHDQILRDRLAAAGRERASAFSWEAAAAGLTRLYEEAAP